MIKLRVIEGPNARDQIAFCAFHSLLMDSKRMLASYMRRMRNNNLEIRIAGSSCRSKLLLKPFAPNSFRGRLPVKSLTRGSNCKTLTGKCLVFWKCGRLYGSWSFTPGGRTRRFDCTCYQLRGRFYVRPRSRVEPICRVFSFHLRLYNS